MGSSPKTKAYYDREIALLERDNARCEQHLVEFQSMIAQGSLYKGADTDLKKRIAYNNAKIREYTALRRTVE